MKTGSRIRLFLLFPGSFLALVLAFLGVKTISTNLMGWFLFLLGVGYMIGGIAYMWLKYDPSVKNTRQTELDEKDDRSFWWMVPGFILTFFYPPLEHLYLRGADRAGLAVQVVGLALVILGLLLRAWTRLIMKGQYTARLQTTPGGALQTGGPYHFIRHPGYAGYLLVSLGISIGFSSDIGLAAVFLILLPGLFYRMTVEEDLLTEQYGDEYLEYAVRTKRLIPGFW